MALSLAKTLSYYKRRDIQEAMVAHAKDKEISFRYDEFFGKRPDILAYPQDVLELAKQKMTSLHCSEELWTNPLQLSTSLKKEELEVLRKGWDLMLDIDCKFFEYSRLAAHFAIQALRDNDVPAEATTIKFSGNKGFHIAVPFEAFPENIGGAEIVGLFPDAPRRIATYITELIRKPLSDAILKYEKGSFSNIMARTQKPAAEITRYEKNEFGDKIPKLNVDPFLEIDTLLISSRHLYRMPYSFHEKSELISVPVLADKILSFEREMAVPERIKVEHPFMDRNIRRGSAAALLRNAFDFKPVNANVVSDGKEAHDASAQGKDFSLPDKAIGEEHFPPCIKLIFEGLEDGRKRSCFALINFLLSCGWEPDLVEKRLLEWNQKNKEPLRDQYILGQLRYTKQQRKIMPPPSCTNPNYYKGVLVCKPDELCARIKNPLQYAKIISGRADRTAALSSRKKPSRKKKEPLENKDSSRQDKDQVQT